MCYLIARCCDGIGCIALRIPHGPQLVTLKQKLIGMFGFGPVELITISRPQAYLEYAPYHIAATEDEFIRAVIKLYESIKGYSCDAEDAVRKEMLALRKNLLAVEEDRTMGRCGISLDELGRRLAAVSADHNENDAKEDAHENNERPVALFRGTESIYSVSGKCEEKIRRL